MTKWIIILCFELSALAVAGCWYLQWHFFDEQVIKIIKITDIVLAIPVIIIAGLLLLQFIVMMSSGYRG